MRSYAAFELFPQTDFLLEWLERRYGIAREVFAAHRFWYRPGSPAVWVAAAECEPTNGVLLESIGMMVTRQEPPRGMLCNVFVHRFGMHATLHVVTLNKEQASLFLNREDVELPEVPEEQGFAIVRTATRPLGTGKVEGRILHSHIPNSWIQG